MFGLDKPVMDAVEKHSSHFYKIMKNSLKVKKEDILIISDYGADDKKMSGMLGYGYYHAAKKKGLKSEIPFGPFLITGTFLAIFWGQSAIDWYLGLIL